MRLITRAGYDRTKRFPWIVEAVLKNRQKRFVIDGEAVILGVARRIRSNLKYTVYQACTLAGYDPQTVLFR